MFGAFRKKGSSLRLYIKSKDDGKIIIIQCV